MKTARKSRKKSKLISKFKSILVYSFISIFVIGFLVNTFLSNILEYSFALAQTSEKIDFKSSEKYPIIIIGKNSIGEIKGFDLIIFDKNLKKVIEYNLSSKLVFESLDEQKNIEEILTQYKKDQQSLDIEKLKKIIEDNIALGVGDVFISNENEYKTLKNVVTGRASIFELWEIKESLHLPLRDLYLMYSFSKNLEFKDFKKYDISSFSSLDSSLRENYLDSVIGKDGLSISIVNATGVSGLARELGRLLSNQGGRVVDLANSNDVSKESKVIFKSKTDSVKKIADVIGISTLTPASEVGYTYPEIIKSDIVVVIGLDKVEK
ncbi:LytR family transcriptional regulator [bacterium]|nr:LytR family transcriptional regulator [bacterium]